MKCVDPATLPCGSKYVKRLPRALSGKNLSCEKFSLCKSGEWKISHCNEGLVHLPESGGNFFKTKIKLASDKNFSCVCSIVNSVMTSCGLKTAL